MNKIVIALSAIVVGVVGFGAGWWSSQSDSSIAPTRSRTVASTHSEYQYEPPAISESEARDHRESNYADLNSIEGVLELPSDFAQTEALYTVAGRASRTGLEQLILQSIDIINRFDRSAALNILFSRYAELDPEAAVEFLVSLNLDIDDQVFSTVFEAWAKFDINGAVAGANQLTNVRQRKRAGRAVLMATSRYHQSLMNQVAADLEDKHELGRIQGEAIAIRANNDPRSAMQEAMAVDGMQGRWSAVLQVASVWARQDPAGALQFTGEISHENIRRQFVSTVLRRWIQDDALQAMQYINAHPDVSEREELLQLGLGVYAQVQPQDALTMASQLSGHAKTQALHQVLSQWAKDDIDAAMGAINALDDSSQRSTLVAMVGQSVAQQSTDKAIAWLEGLDHESRSTQMAAILQQIAQQDPRRALEYALTNTSENDRARTLSTVMQYAIMSDPAAAQDYLGQMPSSTERDGLYRQLAGQMARKDGEAALQWIAGLRGNAKTNALKGAAQSLAGSDPQLSATLIVQMSEKDASETMRSVSSRIGIRDPQSALNWLEQFSGRAGYEPALSEVVAVVARSDPQRALNLAARLSGEYRRTTTYTALSKWASTNPAAAANWASRAEASVRDAAVDSVVNSWVNSDPAAAERWVYSLPTGESKDRAFVRLAGSVTDTARMADFIASISSDGLRQQSIISTYQGILRTDGDLRAANEFLDNVGADTELRDQLSEISGQ